MYDVNSFSSVGTNVCAPQDMYLEKAEAALEQMNDLKKQGKKHECSARDGFAEIIVDSAKFIFNKERAACYLDRIFNDKRISNHIRCRAAASILEIVGCFQDPKTQVRRAEHIMMYVPDEALMIKAAEAVIRIIPTIDAKEGQIAVNFLENLMAVFKDSKKDSVESGLAEEARKLKAKLTFGKREMPVRQAMTLVAA